MHVVNCIDPHKLAGLSWKEHLMTAIPGENMLCSGFYMHNCRARLGILLYIADKGTISPKIAIFSVKL